MKVILALAEQYMKCRKNILFTLKIELEIEKCGISCHVIPKFVKHKRSLLPSIHVVVIIIIVVIVVVIIL